VPLPSSPPTHTLTSFSPSPPVRYAPEKIPYGIKRYQDETRRLYGTYEKHLGDGNKQYLVGGKYSIADICTQPWSVLPALGIPELCVLS
jgi:glutathione S-transferase